MFGRGKQDKTKPGDGSARPRFGLHQILSRSIFGIDHMGRHYEVDVDVFDETADLYVDGAQQATASTPVTFDIEGGQIEVALSTFGVKRAHLIADQIGEQQLTPHPRTAEGWRARFDTRYPALSRAIGVIAVIILLIGLVVLAPALLERITSIEVVAEQVGTFTSPLSLPGWAATTLTVAGVLAALERALTLRSHWLIDADTFWFDG